MLSLAVTQVHPLTEHTPGPFQDTKKVAERWDFWRVYSSLPPSCLNKYSTPCCNYSPLSPKYLAETF